MLGYGVEYTMTFICDISIKALYKQVMSHKDESYHI